MNAKSATSISFHLTGEKKLYFASDFHLGSPDATTSRARETKIIQWLEKISENAEAIFLVGDIFDFWFEYGKTVPKGFLRFQGKLAELREREIPIYLFCGNHDLWLSTYFTTELGISVIKDTATLDVNEWKCLVGHGDGLGPGEFIYKLIKKVFTNPICRWLFKWLHPDVGVRLAHFWSNRSRLSSSDEESRGANEPLLLFSQKIESSEHHDFYVFGHRHLPLELPVSEHATYFGLGDWISHFSYLEIDANGPSLKAYNP